MILERIDLKNFRGYERLSLDLSGGVNVIEGPNGSGKTNLAEAVYCLSMARSWRTPSFAPLVREGADYARITAFLKEGGISEKVDLLFSKAERRVLLNEKPARKLSELSKLTRISLFSPQDVALFKGSPGARRNFLDVSISSRDQSYLEAISRYEKLLGERNALLKEISPNQDLLDVLSGQMATECERIVASRLAFTRLVNKCLEDLAPSLYGANRRLYAVYQPFVRGENSKEAALSAFQKAKEADLLRRVTTVGVHREDFSLLLDGKDVSLFGSQGENRIAAIALKLCPSLVEAEGKAPITILDDVYSELDEERAANLSKVLKGIGQAFVTTVDTIIPGASYIEVLHHNAIRRN